MCRASRSAHSTRSDPVTTSHRERWLAGVVALSIVLITVACALWLPAHALSGLVRENGPLENATVVWYGAALVAVWLAWDTGFSKTSAAAANILMFACIAKEISLRRLLMAAAGYEPGSYDSAAWPNLLALMMVLAALLAATWLLWRYARVFLAALSRREPFAITLAVAFSCLAASQAFDQLSKIAGNGLGLTLSSSGSALAHLVEEVLEMVFPVLLLIAVLQARTRRQNEGTHG